jgi:hypothetical protein
VSYIYTVEINSTSRSILSRKPALTLLIKHIQRNRLTTIKVNVERELSGVLLGVLLTSSDVGEVSHVVYFLSLSTDSIHDF